MEQINEIFDESNNLPVTNLYPKNKIPQIFSINTTDGNVGLRLCSYMNGGDVCRNIKPSDKMMHAIILGVSEKGTLIKLKNLGGNPIGVISTAFNLVVETVKKYKMDAVMFRLSKKKLGGQGRSVQMIISRLVQSRLGGSFVILKDLYDYDKKYMYVLIYRKSKSLQDIQGVPEISSELFTKVESKVGDVYVNKESGLQVSKDEAIAASIAAENDARTDQSVITRSKVSRRQALASQYGDSRSLALSNYTPAALEAYTKTQTEVPVYQASDEDKPSEIVKNYKNIIKKASDEMAREIRSVNETRNYSKISKTLSRTITLSHGINPADEEGVNEITHIISSKMNDVADIIEKYDGVDSISLYKKVVAVILRDSGNKDKEIENSVVTEIVKDLNSHIINLYERSFNSSYKNDKRTPEQSKVISNYCGSAFADMNDFLIGIEDSTAKTVYEKYIPTMDSCFKESPDKLEKGTILYRGNTLYYDLIKKSLDNKIFYFANYVSTSLLPIIFGGFSNAFTAITPSSTNQDIQTSVDNNFMPTISTVTNVIEEKQRINIAFVIHGAEKINVVIPGGDSRITSEAEVILPRGTVLKLNQMWGANKEASYNTRDSLLIEATVIPPSQIDESAEIYDGDALFESSEIKKIDVNPLSFNSFLTEVYVDSNKTEQATAFSNAMGTLANIADISSLEGTRFG